MRSVVNASVVVALILTAVGLAVYGVSRSRQASLVAQCRNNMKQVGLALHAHHDFCHYFPTGTFPNPDFSPEKRFSWTIQIWPTYLEAGPIMKFDRKKAWDDPHNYPPRYQIWDNSHGLRKEIQTMHDCPFSFRCPARPPEGEHTDYVGITGIGENAATLPVADPKAGFFGNDRRVTLADCKHGAETTLAVIEAPDGGPWMAGGAATIRGLTSPPYIGADGQFACNHSRGTNALFADASVRFLTPALASHSLEAMAALAGDAIDNPD